VTLNFDPVSLTFYLWPRTHAVDRLRHGRTLCEISAKSNNPRRCYCSLNIWPYDLEHVSHVAYALGWFARSLNSVKLPFMKCNAFSMLIRHDTLWPWPLTTWPWTFVVLRASYVQTLYKIWAKSNNPRQSYWHLRRSILGGAHFLRTVLQVLGPNFIKITANTERSSPRSGYVSELR